MISISNMIIKYSDKKNNYWTDNSEKKNEFKIIGLYNNE